MARAPNAKAEQAREMFLSGRKLIEIAEALEIPEGTVRSWKNRYHWEEKDNATLQKNKCNVAKKNKEKKMVIEESVEQVLLNPELTDNQQLFCLLYARRPNATQAYMKAYGCSYESALASGPRMLGNVRIQEEIRHLKKERFENQLFGEHDIFQWYLDVATSCITDYVDFGREQVQVMNMFGPVIDKKTKKPIIKEVNYVKFREASEVDGRAIKKVKMGKDGASIELYDAMEAMDWLANHMDIGTSGQQGLAQNIMNAWNKRKAQGEIKTEEGVVSDDK